MVSDEHKFAAAKIGGKMIHASNCCLHFEQEGRVVALMLLQLLAGVGDDAMLAIWVDLGKDGP